MKNFRLYANYSGSDKILVDMSSQVYEKNNKFWNRRFIRAHHQHYIRF